MRFFYLEIYAEIQEILISFAIVDPPHFRGSKEKWVPHRVYVHWADFSYEQGAVWSEWPDWTESRADSASLRGGPC